MTLRASCLCQGIALEVNGSILFTRFSSRPQEVGLALGLLDDDPGGRPTCHVFVGSKAPWHDITDNLPQHEAFPPGWTTAEPRE